MTESAVTDEECSGEDDMSNDSTITDAVDAAMLDVFGQSNR